MNQEATQLWRKENPERVAAMAQRHHQKLRAWIRELKNKPCKDCKHRFPPECMDWDHVRGKKTFSIGCNSRVGRERVLAEIAKCDLVCANCHRIRTARRARERQSSR